MWSGTGRIAGRRTDPAIFFADQIGVRQVFIAAEPPCDSRLFVQILGESFRKPVRQRLGYDCAVIVVIGGKLLSQLVGAVNGHCKSADVVRKLRVES